MSSASKIIQAAAGSGGGPAAGYLAVATGNANNILILDHTTPGTLTLASTYVSSGVQHGVAWQQGDIDRLMASGRNGLIILIDVSNPASPTRETVVDNSGGTVNQVDWSSDDSFIVAGDGNNVELFTHNNGTTNKVSTYTGLASSTINAVKFNYNDSKVYVACFSSPYFCALNRSGNSLSSGYTYSGLTSTDSCYDVDPDPSNNSYLAIAHNNKDGFTRLSDSGFSLSKRDSYNIGNGDGVAYSPDGSYIANVDSSGNLRLFANSASLSPSATVSIGTVSAARCEFSPDGSYLAACTGATGTAIKLYDHTTPGSLTLATTYTLTSGQPRDISFSPAV